MKAAATFCVLATVFFFGTGNAASNADAAAAMKELKATIKLAINELEGYRNTLISDLNIHLDEQKNTALTTLNSITKPALDSVRAEIDAAKANGKNAEHCYEPAKLELTEASKIELDQCTDNAFATVNPVKSNVDSSILVGKRLINRLDNINVNCLLSVYLNYQRCINEEMPRLRIAGKKFEDTVNELKKTGVSLSSSAVNSAVSCNEASVNKVRDAADKVRVSSTKCIANA